MVNLARSPRDDDVGSLSWDADDLRAYRACRIAACDLRLTADGIERFRSEVDWSALEHDRQASELAKRLLVETAAAYVEKGNAALHDYRDRDQPVDRGQEFRAVAEGSPSPLDLVPEFRDYLLTFPRAQLPDVENFLYWSKEKIALHAGRERHPCVCVLPARASSIRADCRLATGGTPAAISMLRWE